MPLVLLARFHHCELWLEGHTCKSAKPRIDTRSRDAFDRVAARHRK